ncbi:MAG: SpoIIE family protein phosphatase [Flavobacteriales bacterium]|nr:SpoIIE family protein phosphatase [Flavobacteriales bacterium]
MTVGSLKLLSKQVVPLLIALVFQGWHACAQMYDFQNFTVEEGLSQSQILCLFQTSTGELWMGTNQGGINRYNGTSFSYLTTEDGLSDNVVFAINQDNDGRILVGTNNGLDLLVGNRIDILNVQQGLPHKGVVSILVDRNENIWLGTGKGVAQLVGDSIILFKEDSILSNSTVLNIREGTDGSIWFCTVQNGLFKWNGESMVNISASNGLNHNYVYDVMPLGKYDAWIFGYRGLFKLENKKVSMIDLPSDVDDNTIVYGYQRDRAGNIWVGTSTGVLKYRSGKWTSHLTIQNGLVDDNIWKILQDREGNMWFGSKSIGVSKLSSERFRLFGEEDGLPQKTVNAVMRDMDGRFWLGTQAGLAIWDGDARDTVKESGGLSSEVVTDIAADDSGTIYIATNFGLTIYKDGRFTKVVSDDHDLNDIRDVFVDGETIWLGTKRGVAKLNDDQLIRPENASEFDHYVFDAVRKENDIWFAYEDGLLRFDGHSFIQLTQKDGFFDGRCRSVLLGKDGTLWFGTNDGVYKYEGTKCSSYGVKDGLIGDAVYSLAFGKDHSLWVGQAKGLSRLIFDGDSLQDVIRYGKDQGFMGLECRTNSFWLEEDGRLWIGTTYGLVEYSPEEDKGEYFKPLTRLTGIRLFGRSVDWLLFADSVTNEGVPISLELPYDKNDLTFEFSGVSLTSPASINYSFMLEGKDTDWSRITNINEVSYTNLDPGRYTFKVRAGFGDDLSENEPIVFHFTIRPPFYQSYWFYFICIMGIGFIAYSYYTIRSANSMITRQKEEIEAQKDVIQKKNEQMIDSINYASTIQSATLPSNEQWHKLLPDSFVLYRPKDIVSGDFYWLAERGDDVFFSAVDCTGHGVPGALMSIVGYNGLNQAVGEQKLSKPADILKHLSTSVNDSLRKSEHDDYVRDGMDIALCKLNSKTMKLEFASAFNPLLIIRNGEQQLIKGDRIAIGSLDTDVQPFHNHEVELQKGDCIYIYSDGYADQFGGTDGKKMKTTVMRQKILELSPLPMEEQKQHLEAYLAKWMGSHEQVDDICVIGVRI